MSQQRTPDPRTTRTRAAILDATSELLATPEGGSASVAEIAKRARVSVGSVYLHFVSKDELIGQLIGLAWERRRASFDAARALATPLARVLAFGDALIDFACEEPVAFRALRLRAVDPPPASPTTEWLLLASPLELLEADLAAAMDAGEIARQVPRVVALVLFAAWSGIAEQAVRRDGLGTDAELVQLARGMARSVLVAGLQTPALAATGPA